MEDKSIIVYAITEKGPDIIHTNSGFSKEKLQEIALYHLLLVAQGTWHHKGIFVLPIPINEINESHKAIYYGFTIYDENQQDPRTNKTRYGCVIVFCSNKILNQMNLITLEEKFNKFIAQTPNYQKLKQKTFFTSLQRFITKQVKIKKKISSETFSRPETRQIKA